MQAEDGIRDLVRSRGLGDVYKRQTVTIEMQFLADVELTCEDCRGMRFKQEVLDIKYKLSLIHI